jgi:uncharacterized protein (TIGR02246 family)
VKLKEIVIASAILIFLLTIESQAQVQGSSDDEAAIREVIVEMTDGFNKHDPVAAARMYSADADFTNVAGMQAKGAAAIEKFLASGFATRLKSATQKTVNVTIRFIRADVAIAHVTNQITGFLGPDGSTEPPHDELSIRVFGKEGGNWRVVAFHNTTVTSSFKRD